MDTGKIFFILSLILRKILRIFVNTALVITKIIRIFLSVAASSIYFRESVEHLILNSYDLNSVYT